HNLFIMYMLIYVRVATILHVMHTFFVIVRTRAYLYLLSFPTRRSSDLWLFSLFIKHFCQSTLYIVLYMTYHYIHIKNCSITELQLILSVLLFNTDSKSFHILD